MRGLCESFSKISHKTIRRRIPGWVRNDLELCIDYCQHITVSCSLDLPTPMFYKYLYPNTRLYGLGGFLFNGPGFRYQEIIKRKNAFAALS